MDTDHIRSAQQHVINSGLGGSSFSIREVLLRDCSGPLADRTAQPVSALIKQRVCRTPRDLIISQNAVEYRYRSVEQNAVICWGAEAC